MTTATDILSRLEELWENAEPGPFEAEDAVILRYTDGTYAFRPRAGYDGEKEAIRALGRAKPKAPEWEAVVASYIGDEEHKREVFFRTPRGSWESVTRYVDDPDLVDPVPLVELPEREELADAIVRGWTARRMGEGSPSPRGSHEADAVLELLKRR